MSPTLPGTVICCKPELPTLLKNINRHKSVLLTWLGAIICHNPELPIFFHDATAPVGSGHPHYWGFTSTLRHTSLVGLFWTRDRPNIDLYLTRHNKHNRQISTPRQYSNPQSQKASDRRPTPHTAGSAPTLFPTVNLCHQWARMSYRQMGVFQWLLKT